MEPSQDETRIKLGVKKKKKKKTDETCLFKIQCPALLNTGYGIKLGGIGMDNRGQSGEWKGPKITANADMIKCQ